MYWIGETGGFLGNKLFTFSAFISAAIYNNKITISPHFKNYAKFFPYFDSFPPSFFTMKIIIQDSFFMDTLALSY